MYLPQFWALELIINIVVMLLQKNCELWNATVKFFLSLLTIIPLKPVSVRILDKKSYQVNFYVRYRQELKNAKKKLAP